MAIWENAADRGGCPSLNAAAPNLHAVQQLQSLNRNARVAKTATGGLAVGCGLLLSLVLVPMAYGQLLVELSNLLVTPSISVVGSLISSKQFVSLYATVIWWCNHPLSMQLVFVVSTRGRWAQDLGTSTNSCGRSKPTSQPTQPVNQPNQPTAKQYS